MKYFLILITGFIAIISALSESNTFFGLNKANVKNISLLLLMGLITIQLIVQRYDNFKEDEYQLKIDTLKQQSIRAISLLGDAAESLKCDFQIDFPESGFITDSYLNRVHLKFDSIYEENYFSTLDTILNYPKKNIPQEAELYDLLHDINLTIKIFEHNKVIWSADYNFSIDSSQKMNHDSLVRKYVVDPETKELKYNTTSQLFSICASNVDSKNTFYSSNLSLKDFAGKKVQVIF